MKTKILHQLWTAPEGMISGVTLSRRLGISRVAVWKHIQQINTHDQIIESGPKGYCLARPEDLLHPFCFPGREDRILFFPQLGSTMDEARARAGDGAPHLSVVVADLQTQGRGRMNRTWFSQKGGLWFTLILRPDLPPPLAFKVNFAASCSLATTLNRLFNTRITVKWPNDLLFDGRKLAGMLSEMETRGDMIEFVNIGMGININNDPTPDEPRAVSLQSIVGRPVSRQKILAAFLDHLEPVMADIAQRDVITPWKKITSTIGQTVTIETQAHTCRGTAVDVDDTGALILRRDDGTKKRIIYGDCFHTPAPTGIPTPQKKDT